METRPALAAYLKSHPWERITPAQAAVAIGACQPVVATALWDFSRGGGSLYFKERLVNRVTQGAYMYQPYPPPELKSYTLAGARPAGITLRDASGQLWLAERISILASLVSLRREPRTRRPLSRFRLVQVAGNDELQLVTYPAMVSCQRQGFGADAPSFSRKIGAMVRAWTTPGPVSS